MCLTITQPLGQAVPSWMPIRALRRPERRPSCMGRSAQVDLLLTDQPPGAAFPGLLETMMRLGSAPGRKDYLWSLLFRLRPVRNYAASRFFRGTPHCVELGIRVLRADQRRLVACIDWREDLVGDPVHGYLHGGVITTLADQVSGAAASLSLRPIEVVATLDLRIDHLRPASRGKTVYAEAHCYRIARRIVFVRCLVHDGNPQNPVATSASAFVRKGPMTRRYRAVR